MRVPGITDGGLKAEVATWRRREGEGREGEGKGSREGEGKEEREGRGEIYSGLSSIRLVGFWSPDLIKWSPLILIRYAVRVSVM